MKDVCLVSLFGLILPSTDQGTNYYTAANLINHEHECRSDNPTWWCPEFGTEERMQNEELRAPGNYEKGEEQIQDDEARVRRYGYAMLAPILLMTIFSIRQWWRLEKKQHRWLTFPLVILQLYPQYRVIRILYLTLMKKTSWRKEKDIFDRDLSSLGKFVYESHTSIHFPFSNYKSDDMPYLPLDVQFFFSF